ncbi:amino acid adenylation domain-containing protein [Pseudomonas sichuanensis]|uniref:non-ribosomal peptide synthetase n=1 Tax=Pseudomonas sichuanensis TaxID=2213015 RepID=UPI0024482317|nr:non-ribosomal peptide synthetase [Pseudomonas sichuanensis]MDH0732056.1 amino acid adenylation domain-containing protein [Pseudomonas sichuanensis]MDH1584860.1 amino acid adenylation domain-containing protein [Pseudomonas sichuanensis]MDH1593455.1 amino acid adenylation domain-containing protein [Pseudomonas sichuanensis]MDH1599154.1 amino acid adenylation domain-containing protein [Pseudomonas sichuanensis]
MSINQLLATLTANNVQLALKDGQLVVQGNRQALTDAALVARLREHKPALVAMIERGEYVAVKQGAVPVPANLIEPGCTRITPQQVNLIDLDQASLDRLVASIPGGAANVQDIYPLAPLQQGMLFHHASATDHDPYVMQARFAFASEDRLQAFADALRGVIARHDILRTSVHWQGLQTPVQVVWREAELKVLELPEQDPQRARLDLTQAPLIRLLREPAQADGTLSATLQFHHIAMDHSALDVVRHELIAFLTGEHQHLGAPVPFRNYVAQAVLGISEAQHEAFFREMLGDIDESTLAYGIQDVQGDGVEHNEHALDLPPGLCQRLRAYARGQGVSVASLFHLAWGRVLGGLTGRTQVVFGTVLMGRLQGAEATDRALGIFINTLPLRIDLDGVDLPTAIRATHQRLSALMRHEHAPLALAQRCSGVAAPAPLFNTLLNYRHSTVAAGEPRRAALAGIDIVASAEATNYPLTLSIDDLGEAFRLTLLASAGVPAQRVCAYLQQTLESLLQAPAAQMLALDMLPGSEREELLEGFNDSSAHYQASLTLQQRIERQAQAHPQDTAATQAGESLTYADLNRQANALAHHLIGLGVGADDRIAVVARRGLDTLVGLLAVLKAGAGYVPIDPAHPDERVHYLLTDSAPVAVLTQQALSGRLGTQQVPVLLLDRPDWPVRGDNPALPALSARHLAYVIYTSGSTGQPKGVMVEHQTVNNLVDWHCRTFDLCHGRHTSCLAGLGFDAMAWELWPALCAGATLHLAPSAQGNEDLDAMLAWWRDQPLDVSFLPTPVAEYAFSHQLEHPTLRTLLIGGDRLRQFNRTQRFAVVNNYGPTETTVVASSGVVEAGGVLHIGRPVDNARLYVLDERRQPVALGVPGELYIGGAGVARGYLNRPALTAERFLDDPFTATPGGRMYRTGDLVRWLADGTLDYLGRNDDQVKIRGVRIELGEIESRLATLPGINEAVVLAREDQPGEPRLVAYFTPQADVDAATPENLRAQLQAHLPEYMVPVAFVELAALPLTANGKLDRRALPKPERSALFEQGFQAPEGELENALAQLWAELLQVERVGRHDHFFTLGGHSLLAMRMVSQVRLRLGVELTLAKLFANAELAAVAAVLANAGRSELPAIVPVPREQPLPMSFAQQRLWFLAQMEGGNQAYNVPLALGLRGPLDADALEAALRRIVERHETLRSRFVPCDDSAEVIIAATVGGDWFQREMSSHDALAAKLREEASAPFDLAHGPLLRARLLRLGAEHHVLALTVHHIVADGWSLGVLTQELRALYPTFCQGLADPLPPLPIQYGDYAVWQRRWLAGEQLQRQADYWRKALDGAPTLLKLPSDRPRPERQDFAGANLPLQLDPRLAAGLRTLAQRHGVTLYMALLGAWAALLARLAGQAEVVIGCPVAGRGRAELEALVGLFVNTLAIRIDTGAAPTAQALLEQVRNRVLEAQAHQDLPFEQVVEIVRPARSLAHTPLFQATLNWQATHGPALELQGLQLEAVAQAGQVAKFDLTLNLGEHGEALAGSLEYATALFDESTVRRYLGYFERLLWAMVGNDQATLAHIDLIGDEERHNLLHTLNATQRDYPRDHSVQRLFEQCVARHPLAPAAAHGELNLSYGELNARANRLAHYLIAEGVAPGACVAILLPRSLQLLVAQLAVLKCAAVYVPLDVHAPVERQAFMVEDCQATALLTLAVTAADFPVRRIDLDQLALDSQPAHDPGLPRDAGASAYVMYTSGTTGIPKGVCVPHRGIVRLVMANGYADFTTQDRVGFASNPAFDASTLEVWGALLSGGQVRVIDHPTLVDPQRFAVALVEEGISVLFLTTALFNQYVQLLPEALAGLRILISGGERAEPAAFRALLDRAPTLRLVNGYGPTETTTFAVTCEVRELAANATQVPIGQPIGNTQVYVLDAHQQLVPRGVVGELYIGGDGVALGYLNRPALTAERFVEDPFSQQAGARLYRTGDLVRWQADGQLECLGRNDDQVKIRGFRIELGEIQQQLAQCPGVGEVIVMAVPAEQGPLRLVAWFTRLDAALQASDLRSYLRGRLPEYMVPAAFVALQRMPLSNNGKVERKALPQPGPQDFAGAAYEAPQGQQEQLLAQLWGELLQVERVGRDDRFFEMGGHSLLAMRMLAQVRQRLGLELALADLFADDRLAAVAAGLASHPAQVLPALQASPRVGPLPLSFAQQRLWFLAQMAPGSAAYHIPIGLRLRGTLDAVALERALRRLVERHESLRSHFVGLDGEPQVVLATEAFSLATVKVPGLDEQVLAALVEQEASRPFVLHRDLPIRGRLLHLAADHHVLLLTLHHLVADGWSLGVLVRELDELYQAFSQGRDDPLAALPVQYLDYALWQRRTLGGDTLQRQAHYWAAQLAGAPTLISLPWDRPRPEHQDHAGDSVALCLDPRLSVELKALCRSHGVTPYMLFMAAWAVLLTRLAGQDEVVIGSPLANRRQAEVDGLIGMFVNSIAVRVQTSGAPDVASLLAQVKATVLAAQAHQDLPFEQVVEALRPQRSLAHTPVYQVSLDWEGSPQRQALQLGELAVTALGSQARIAKFDLSLSMGEGVEGFAGGIVYATALFDRATIERYAGYLEQLLWTFVEGAQAIPAHTGLPDADERKRLLLTFNDTAVDYNLEQTLHGLIEAQVERTPDAVAVRAEEGALSYRKLNEQANRLAYHLIALGVKPDDRVAICVERGLSMVVGLLAILKAGGAYVPVDPDYPAERVRHMLTDSAPVAVLVHAATRHVPVCGRLIDLDQPTWGEQPACNPVVTALTSRHLAYVIYTSGSTGLPKGVMNEHAGVVNRLLWMQDAYNLDADDVVLQKTPFSFDVSVWEFLWPLQTGARLVMARPGGHRDPEYLREVIRRESITTLHFVPSMLDVYLAHGEASADCLKRVLCSGEALPGSLVRRFHAQLPSVELHNLYGPTEAAVDVSAWHCVAAPDNTPIGKPIANSTLYVLDGQGQPVPQGVAGELFIGGVQVARGYFNRAELTAERFIDDPFSTRPGARLYRTGDLARHLPDGNIEYLGRNDDQVKIRGLRIELGEIQAGLTAIAGIKEAVVVARDQRLVAYYTGEAQSTETLRSALLTHLPEFMVPALFMHLEALPLSPNGKLDRKALPEPDAIQDRPYEAPEGETETQLAAIWAELLGVERVGRHDNFFELGGHSLAAIRLIDKLVKAGLQAALNDVFQQPSVALLARHLDASHAGRAQTVVTVRGAGSQPALFLVHEFTGLDFYFPVLGQHLPGDFPLYGLPGVPYGEPQPRTLECLARYQIEQLRKVQPHGPYRLAGWSFGGVLAFEMANQLLGADEQVEFLGLIDTYTPRLADQGKARWQGPRALERQLLLNCSTFWRTQGEAGEARLAQLQRLEAEQADFNTLLASCREHQLLYGLWSSMSDAQLHHYFTRELAHGHAMAHYRLAPLSVPVHLFRAEQGSEGLSNLGWREALPAQALVEIAVPGDHRSMMQAPHVALVGEAIAQALDRVAARPAEQAVAYQPLVAIQTGQHGHAPLFCVPGAGDSVTSFVGLAEALGPDWPLYGLQARGLDGCSVPHVSVQAAVDCHVQAIEALYPQGPLNLVGHSFGGWVAHAMAARFEAKGRQVRSLTLIDSEAPGDLGTCGQPYTFGEALQRLIDALQLSTGKALCIEPLAFAQASDEEQLRQLHGAMVRVGLMPARSLPKALEGTVRTFATALRTEYQPTLGYSGPVGLVLVDDPSLDAAGNAREQAKMQAGWQQLMPQLALWQGPGDHFSILKVPDVFSLAAWWHDGQALQLGKVTQ